jgi:hypothetical protein
VVEADASGDQHDEDRGGDPVDDQAERRPPSGVSHILAAVLPKSVVLVPGGGAPTIKAESGSTGAGLPDLRGGMIMARASTWRVST